MKELTYSIVFTGDVSFDKYMDGRWNDKDLLSDEIYDFLYDSNNVIVNLEGALYQPLNTEGSSAYFHAMNPEAVSALRNMRADIWSISNNHIMDAGKEGIISTINNAKKVGCKTFGAGLNEDEASRPIIIDNKAGGVGIISVGYHNECVPATANSAGCFCWDNMELISNRIAEIKNRCRWCIVVSHGGEEFSPVPLPYTRDRYIKYLKMGADVVVGHHPHVVENYEMFEDGKIIFYSLGNFIFDTDYQRSHLYTDIGVLLKLNFTNEKIDFESIGIKINRTENKIVKYPLPDIFTNISSDDYELLAPLGAKAFIAEDMRKMIYLEPSKYNDNSEALESYFSGCSHEDYVKGSHMDFNKIIPLAEEYEKLQWQDSKLEKVKNYILTLL